MFFKIIFCSLLCSGYALVSSQHNFTVRSKPILDLKKQIIFNHFFFKNTNENKADVSSIELLDFWKNHHNSEIIVSFLVQLSLEYEFHQS